MPNQQLFADNLRVVLANGVSADATIFPLESTALIPLLENGDFITLTFYGVEGGEETNREIVRVNAVSGNDITVVRGFSGSIARAWPIGTRAELRNNAFTMGRLRDGAEAAQAAASQALNAANAAAKPTDLIASKIAYTRADNTPSNLKTEIDALRLAQQTPGAVQIASANTAGVIKSSPTIVVDQSTGVASAQIPLANPDRAGLMRPGPGVPFDPATGIFTLPAGNGTGTTYGFATATVAGLAKTSATWTVDPATGIATSRQPIATPEVAGLFRPGAGLTTNPTTGVTNVNFPPAQVIPEATATVKGIAAFGVGMTVQNGVVSVVVPLATAERAGLVRPGPGLAYDPATGILSNTQAGGSFTPQLGSKTQPGYLQVGDNINVVNGVISVTPGLQAKATTTALGSIIVGDNLSVDGNGRLSAAGSQGNVTYTTMTFGVGKVDSEGNSLQSSVKQLTGRSLSVHDQGVMYIVNLADYVDPKSASDDVSATINDALNYASNLAQAMRGTLFAEINRCAFVRAFLPHGNYRLSKEQIIIPSNVDHEMFGVYIRGSTSTSTNEMFDKHLPMLVASSHAHASRVNLQCQETGRTSGGSGFAAHRVFEAETIDLAPITGAGGSGYVANEEFDLPRRAPVLEATRIKVTTVTNGAITGFTVVNKGTYDCHIRQIGNLRHFKLNSSGAQVGAYFKVTAYEPTYRNGQYSAGRNRTFGETLIDHLNVNEAGISTVNDSVKGSFNGIHILGLNQEINQMYCIGSRYGAIFTDGSDCRINNYNSVLCGTAFRTIGFGALTIANFAHDTTWHEVIKVTGAQGIVMRGRYFWENNAGDNDRVRALGQYALASGAAINIDGGGNTNQLASGMNWNIQCTNPGGSRASSTDPKKWVQFAQPVAIIDGLSGSEINLSVMNGDYGGRMQPLTKPVNCVFQFGSKTETQQNAEWYLINEFRTVSAATQPANSYKVKEAVTGGGRLLQDNNTFSGSISNLGTNDPVYKGDAAGNNLRIYDGDLGGTCGRDDIYTGLTRTTAPFNGYGNGKCGPGSEVVVKTNPATKWINVGTKAATVWKQMTTAA